MQGWAMRNRDWKIQVIPLQPFAWTVALTAREPLTGCLKKNTGYPPVITEKLYKDLKKGN